MATGSDELLDFLLSGIAFCGAEGASSADFRRLIDLHHHELNCASDGPGPNSAHPPKSLDRGFYEQAWQWLIDRPDVRIYYQHTVHRLSLSEFEALETQAADQNNVVPSIQQNGEPAERGHVAAVHVATQPSSALSSLSTSLRQRLSAETTQPVNSRDQQSETDIPIGRDDTVLALSQKMREPRKIPKRAKESEPAFDEPSPSIKAPRLFTSQARKWKAIAGHPFDVKKVPPLEFVLLSLIATAGPNGIAQPRLQKLSGQDKRSVPKRTDELAKKGYILKKPIQEGKARTSLCIHKKFAKDVSEEAPSAHEVFGVQKLDLTGFVYLLDKLLRTTDVVQVRQLRLKMGIDVKRWSGRAVRGALIRLEQTEYIKRFQFEKKKKDPRSQSQFIVCIKRLRDPTEEDVKNLKFKRVAHEPSATDAAEEEPLEDDDAGDGLMRDMELDMMDTAGSGDDDHFDIPDRIPPQWTPDRLLPNMVFDFVKKAGVNGTDTARLRNLTAGYFWKRPLESLIGRLTDGWTKSQPPHIRHLAIVRDTVVTTEKRRVVYLYRTYENAQKAVDAGEASWEALGLEDPEKGALSKKQNSAAASVDDWGFPPLNANDFHRRTGSSTLVETSTAIVQKRRKPPAWESEVLETDHQPSSTPGQEEWETTPITPKIFSGERERVRKSSNKNKPPPLLTTAQRVHLGLPAKGRLGVGIEEQIRAHRKKTGDPNSIPKELQGVGDTPRSKPQYEKRPGSPLLTLEQREAGGARGRLSFEVTQQILNEQGRQESLTHMERSADIEELEDHLALGNDKGPDGSVPPIGKQAEPQNPISVDDEDTPMLDDNQDANGVSSTVEVQTTSQPVSNSAGSPSLHIKRGPRKRSAKEDGDKNGPPKKRTRKQLPANDTVFPLQENAFTYSGELLNAPMQSTGSGRDISGSLPHTEALEIGQSLHLPSEVPARDEGPAGGEPGTSWRTVNVKAPRKFAPNVAAQKPRCLHREPGLYINPSATRPPANGGRGRPKKAFMATFKLPGLQHFDWFVSDTARINVKAPVVYSTAPVAGQRLSTPRHASPASPGPEIDASNDARLSPGTAGRLSPNQEPVALSPISPTKSRLEADVSMEDATPIMNAKQAESITSSTAESFDPEVPQGITTYDGISDKPAKAADSLHEAVHPSMEEADQPSKSGIDVPEALQLTAVADVVEDHQRVSEESASGTPPRVNGAQPKSPSVLSSSDARRLPPTMNTAPSLHHTPYQSPYGPPPSQTSSRPKTPDISHAIASQDTPIPEEDGTPIPEEDGTPDVEAPAPIWQKRTGVVRGKGTVQHARARVLRHIFDLCGGAFPGNGEIYPVFESAWADIGPKKIVCPNQATIRKSVQSLCHPLSDVNEMAFIVPGGLPGNTRKRLYFYKHLKPTSPEVVRIMKGIIENYPGKYYPPEVEKYRKDRVKPVRKEPEIDNSLADLYLETSQKLDERVKEDRLARKKAETAARAEQRKKEKKKAKRLAKERGGKHQRLVGLDHGLQSGLGRALQKPIRGSDQQDADQIPPAPPLLSQWSRENSPSTDSSDDELQTNIRPRPQAIDETQSASRRTPHIHVHTAAMMTPLIRYQPSTHTFSTDFVIDAPSTADGQHIVHGSFAVDDTVNGRKRVRIEEPEEEASRKKPRQSRPGHQNLAERMAEFMKRHHVESDESSDEDETTAPTIAERLAGLTGDLDQPDYEPRQKKKQHRRSTAARENRLRRDRERRRYKAAQKKYPEAFSPLREFNKLCYTLVIASSMAGENGNIDWNIVKKVYSDAPRFDLEKTKKMWTWMQRRMAAQLQGMMGSFQSYFLSAYEEGKIDQIQDPNTYDWAKLVRWASLKCTYREPPLPFAREALNDCQIDISSYEVLDRTVWYNTTLTGVNREERFAKYSFGSPLHRKQKPSIPEDDYGLKARALIRSNISTPKELYNKQLAHEKLRELPESALESTVDELMRASYIKMRKIKRLLPGRNYLFTPQFAKHYRRTFELSDFMTAVQLKKDLDTAFAASDPDRRAFFVSRTAESGTVMALMSLASEGKVKLVPKLPPIKNGFDAPLPRISVWGFSEGDYIHRKMDRQRLFWPMEVVPTEAYGYGNPLQPSPFPLAPTEDGKPANWTPLPEPPLAHRYGSALLPIWNSIDGQSVIYPWWNRILNIVIQSLLFQPGNTAAEIFARCETYVTEIFEIQLVLDWLVHVKAAQRTPHGTYEPMPGYWAVFGDKLIDEEKDEFGEYVKRKPTNQKHGATWRSDYATRFAALQQQQNAAAEGAQGEMINNVRKQYTIAANALDAAGASPPAEDVQMGGVPSEAVSATTTTLMPAGTPGATPSTSPPDVEMTDPDKDAEGEDEDAEGEPDDDYPF